MVSTHRPAARPNATTEGMKSWMGIVTAITSQHHHAFLVASEEIRRRMCRPCSVASFFSSKLDMSLFCPVQDFIRHDRCYWGPVTQTQRLAGYQACWATLFHSQKYMPASAYDRPYKVHSCVALTPLTRRYLLRTSIVNTD